MKRIWVLGLMAASAAAGTALAADDTGAWYFSPMLQYNKIDDHRQANQDYGYQLGLGYDLPKEWAAELNYGSFETNHRAGGPALHLYQHSIDVLKKFAPDADYHPYLIGGTGELDDVVPTVGYKRAWMAEAGAGIITGIGDQTGSTRWQFRAEGKYRYEFINHNVDGVKDPKDLLFGIGVQFMFGAPEAKPMLAAAAPPPPPPPAAEPPPPPPPPPVMKPLDSDGDGVPDSMDKCPNTPKGDKVDANGCTIRDEIKLEGVHFATDSAKLTDDSDEVLGYAVRTLKAHPELVIEVRGHTDNTGSKKHNLVLSQHRAESVMEYLRAHGVTNTLTAKGYGEDLPIASNATAEGRAQNRRVTLKIVGGN